MFFWRASIKWNIKPDYQEPSYLTGELEFPYKVQVDLRAYQNVVVLNILSSQYFILSIFYPLNI